MKMRARQAERLKAAAPQLYGLLEAIWSKSRQLFVIAALLLLEFELRDSKSPGVIVTAIANSEVAISGTSGRTSATRRAPDNKSLDTLLANFWQAIATISPHVIAVPCEAAFMGMRITNESGKTEERVGIVSLTYPVLITADGNNI